MCKHLKSYINVLTVGLSRKRGRRSGWTSSHSLLSPNTNLTFSLWANAAQGKCIIQSETP